MIRCFYLGCENNADYIDDADNYICNDCMEECLENNYTGQVREDFESLDWGKFPVNGFCE